MMVKIVQNFLRVMSLTLIICLFAVSAIAFNVTGYGIYARQEVDPSNNHVRLGFTLASDDSFHFEDITWTITSPDFDVTVYGSSKYDEEYCITGTYDESEGFQFSPVESSGYYFRSKIANNPETGASYTLAIRNENGDEEPEEFVIDDILFNPERDPDTGDYIYPPMIDIDTLTHSVETIDEEEYLRLDWELPGEMGNCSLRIILENRSNWRESISLTLPNTMNYAIIPFSVIQQFENISALSIRFCTKIADQNARSYSDYKVISFPGLAGSISGTVFGHDDSEPDTPDVPVPNMRIQVFTDACNWTWFDQVLTDDEGNYVINGVPFGETIYLLTNVRQSDTAPYADQYYGNDRRDCRSAVPVSITAEEGEITNIDFHLTLGGIISGHIVDSEGSPVEDVDVSISEYPCGEWRTSGETNKEGYFEIKGVPNIPVILRTWSNPEKDQNYVNIYWDGTEIGTNDCANASPINIPPGEHLVDFDMTLQPAGSISGTVINAAGDPISNMHVYVRSGHCDGDWLGGANTGADGRYTITGLPSGECYARTCSECEGLNYIDESFDNVTNCGEAQPITVIQGETTENIDFSLLPGGGISGTVTDAAGEPISNMHVYVQSGDCDGDWLGGANTDPDGNYTITGLPPGQCYARTCSECEGLNYIDESFDNVTDCGDAQPITVNEGETTENIDFELQTWGMISGTVYESDGTTPIPDVPVDAYSVACDGGTRVGGGGTDENGYFNFMLPRGTYFLNTNASHDASSLTYVDEFYTSAGGTIECDNAEGIEVNLGESVEGINFSLAPGGSISGTVTDAAGDPISNMDVYVQSGDCDGDWLGWANTDSSGHYTITGLPSGQCYARTCSECVGLNYIDESFDNVTDCGEAQPITVIQGETTENIDFSLASGGSISGTVYGDDDNNSGTPDVPVPNMHIQVFTDTCNWHHIMSVNTDDEGKYVVNGLLIGGEIFLLTCVNCSDTEPYVDEYYGIDSRDCNGAVPITVLDGNTPDIDFHLAAGGIISGHLFDPYGNPVNDLEVYVESTPCDGGWLTGQGTNDDGFFQIKGIPDVPVYLHTWANSDLGQNYFDVQWDGTPSGTTNCGDAVSINVEPFAHLENLNLTLQPSPEYIVLSNTMLEVTVTSGRPAIIYGTAEANHVILESGADVELLHFPGSNFITLPGSSEEYYFCRSGAVVTAQGSDGTTIRFPATTSAQTFELDDGDFELIISGNQIVVEGMEVPICGD